MASYTFGPALSDRDLESILTIQHDNTPQAVSASEQREQGFVTVRHDLDLLRAMNQAFPHTVARCKDRVVGYALCMLPGFVTEIPALEPLFELIGRLQWRGATVAPQTFAVMGQVAVAKDHRGQHLVDKMYTDLCRRLQPRFDLLFTSIAIRNTRSLRVHERTGFVELVCFVQHGERWVVVGRTTEPAFRQL